MDIKWTDTDPESKERLFYKAEKFAGRWTFFHKFARREDWIRGITPTREMWEFLLDALKARYRRREGVSEADVKLVEQALRDYQEPPSLEDDKKR